MRDQIQPDLDLPEESNPLVELAFLAVVCIQILVTTTSWDSRRSVLANLSPAWWFPGLLVIALVLLFRTNSLRVAGSNLVLQKRLGPWKRTTQWPLAELRVAVELFSFAPWDPHVAIHHRGEIFRIGAGLSETRLRHLADQLQSAIDASTNPVPERDPLP